MRKLIGVLVCLVLVGLVFGQGEVTFGYTKGYVGYGGTVEEWIQMTPREKDVVVMSIASGLGTALLHLGVWEKLYKDGSYKPFITYMFPCEGGDTYLTNTRKYMDDLLIVIPSIPREMSQASLYRLALNSWMWSTFGVYNHEQKIEYIRMYGIKFVKIGDL